MAHATATAIAGDRPPRYGCQNRLSFTVGRGPVPRHASTGKTALAGARFSRRSTIAGETRSDARMASEGPRATVVKTVSLSP